MDNVEKTPAAEGKVIQMKKYTSSVHNSPLLSSETVEVKAYTSSLNTVGNKQTTTVEPQAQTQPVAESVGNVYEKTSPPPADPPKQQTINSNYSFNPVNNDFKQPENNEFMPPPPPDDGIDPMAFGEDPGEVKEEGDEMPAHLAMQNAGMMIGMYSALVPPIIANMLKNDIGKFKMVLGHNKQIPLSEVNKLEKFLHSNNLEIEKALQLTKEQVSLLKTALAEVLKQYKIEPKNPLVNLLMVIIGIAVTQFMAIRQIMVAQNQQLMSFIENFKVTIPEGMENPMVRKTKIFGKKPKVEFKEAA